MSYTVDVIEHAKARGVDGLGEPLEPGYEPVQCGACSALCNFEAMTMCILPNELCPMMRPEVESAHGIFALVRRVR